MKLIITILLLSGSFSFAKITTLTKEGLLGRRNDWVSEFKTQCKKPLHIEVDISEFHKNPEILRRFDQYPPYGMACEMALDWFLKACNAGEKALKEAQTIRSLKCISADVGKRQLIKTKSELVFKIDIESSPYKIELDKYISTELARLFPVIDQASRAVKATAALPAVKNPEIVFDNSENEKREKKIKADVKNIEEQQAVLTKWFQAELQKITASSLSAEVKAKKMEELSVKYQEKLKVLLPVE